MGACTALWWPVAPRGGHQPGMQLGGMDSAAVAHRGQPAGESFHRQPIGAVLAVEAGQEGQADRSANSPTALGKTFCRCARS